MHSYAALSPYLRTSARERVKQIPVRMFLAVLIAWTLHTTAHGQWIAPWLVTSLAVQAFEFLAMAPFRSPRPPERLDTHRAILPALAAILAMSVVHCGVSAVVWMSGGHAQVTVAVLILTGGLLNNVASGVESRPLFLIGAAPYLLTVAAMPIAMIVRGDMENMPLLVFTVVLFLAAIYGVWSRTHKTWMAEALALAQSQTRLEQAEAAMADRAAMAAIVSHELRTPVSAILAGAHVIRHGGRPEDVAQTADLIIDASRLMTGMLNDLLDHSKIEARAMTLELRDFDIDALIRDVAHFWGASAAEKGLGFTIDGAGDATWLCGDPHRLRQILNNLISNAIKFTDQGGVTLALQADQETDGRRRVSLTVSDQGKGIAPDAMARLFSPFAQGSSEVARTYGGTGLGLTVSRDLAVLMGGCLTAHSVLGEGTRFVLDLVLPTGAPVLVDEADAAPAPALPRRLRVLAVDDHEINRRTVSLVLQPLDVDLVAVGDGATALALLFEEPFDVVLMDVNMPGIDGNETTRRLRKIAGPNAQTPVIGFSAGTEDRQVQACLAAGMTDWLAKPLEPLKLYAALERATRPAEARAADAA